MSTSGLTLAVSQQRSTDNGILANIKLGLSKSCLEQVERGYNRTLVYIVPQQEFFKRFMTVYISLRANGDDGASIDETLHAIREAACTIKDQIREEILELESRLLDPSSVLDGEAAELSVVQLHRTALSTSSGRRSMTADQGHRASVGIEDTMEENANVERGTTRIVHEPQERHRIIKAVRGQGVSNRGRNVLGDVGVTRKRVEPIRRRSRRIARMQQAGDHE